MVVRQQLSLQHGQQLVMTPQLQLSLKLLQFSNLELAEFVNTQLEENPLLLTEKPDSDTDPDTDKTPEAPSEMVDSLGDSNMNSLSETDNVLDVSHENVWDSGENSQAVYDGPSSNSPLSGTAAGEVGQGYNFDQAEDKDRTLRDHIHEQIALDFPDVSERFIALNLADELDDAGYLKADIADIVARLGCTHEDVEHIIARLQMCDPSGVFARDLSECLAIQLRDLDRLDPCMEAFVMHLPLLSQGKTNELMEVCGINAEEFSEMMAEIRHLNPKPGNNFSTQHVQVVQPDAFARRSDKGEWSVELNNETLPRCLVDKTFYANVKSRAQNAEEKAYLVDQYQTANWLVKSMHQRAETILRVSTEIIRQQHAFFEKGIYHLKPMTLNSIAEKLDIHESTVGRVTTNKYMATPNGLYELKFFFTSGVGSSDGGDDVSSVAVKQMIKELVEGETVDAILSDDKLVELLKHDGVDIARRTVAKYREAMGVGSSVERRRMKKAAF